MLWIVIILVIGVFAAFLDSTVGKITTSAAVVGIALLLLGWITGFNFLYVLAKACVVIIIITIAATLLLAILG